MYIMYNMYSSFIVHVFVIAIANMIMFSIIIIMIIIIIIISSSSSSIIIIIIIISYTSISTTTIITMSTPGRVVLHAQEL